MANESHPKFNLWADSSLLSAPTPNPQETFSPFLGRGWAKPGGWVFHKTHSELLNSGWVMFPLAFLLSLPFSSGPAWPIDHGY